MPPKSASTPLARWRNPRATARKFIPAVSLKPNSTPPITSHPTTINTINTALDSAVTPPPPTVISTSPEGPHKIYPIKLPDTRNDSQNPRRAVFVSQPQNLNSEKSLVGNPDLLSDIDCKNNVRDADTGTDTKPNTSVIEAVGFENPRHFEAQTLVEGRDGRKSGPIIPDALVMKPSVQEECSVEPKAESSSAVGGDAGSGSGKRKAVKRTVRVVKKIIKKRVPKRVLVDSLEHKGSVKTAENGSNLCEVTQNSTLVNAVMEKPNLSNEAIDRSNLVNDMMENHNFVNQALDKSNVANEVKENSETVDKEMEILNIEAGTCFMGPMDAGNVNDPSAIDPMGTDHSKINNAIVAESDEQELNGIVLDSMEVKKVGSASDITMENATAKWPEVTVADNLSKDFVLENENVGLGEDQNMDAGKRKVRVVKKMVKKRVPKMVLMDSLQNERSVKRVENGLNLSDVTEKSHLGNLLVEKANLGNEAIDRSNLVNDMIEKYNIGNQAIDKSNIVNEVKEKSKTVNAGAEKLNIETGTHFMGPMEAGKDNNPSAIDSMETDRSKINNAIIADSDKLKTIVLDSMEVKMVGSAADITMESLTAKCREVTVADNLSKDFVLESENVGLVEDQNMDAVKRKVRVVKKIVKKRVPKRVLMDSLENNGSVKRAENGSNSSEVTDKSDLVNVVMEKSNFANEAVDRSNLVIDVMEKYNFMNQAIDKSNMANEVKENPNTMSERMEKLYIKTGKHFVGPMEVGKGNDLSAIDLMETGQSKTHDVVVAKLDKRDSNAIVFDSMEVKKVGYAAGITMESEIAKCLQANIADNLSSDLVLENEKLGTIENENVGLFEDQNVDAVGETGSLTLAGDQKVCPVRENGSGNCSVIEGVKEMKSNGAGLLLSGEMEALQQKKRRQTEIFVGGLDKDTKEDDIRKVFDEAGEIVEVRLVMNNKTGKNKGFAFVQFANTADAKKALATYSKVEIRGKQCEAAPVEGNDTILLGNINKKWKMEDVVKLLEKAGIDKIDAVTIKADPNNAGNNRGFAFVEFERHKDAQIAFHKLQKKNIFGKNLNIKVAWAEPLIEPAEEQILKVKSVYAEYLPSSWDEEKVKEYFKRFGDIENVVLAKELHLPRKRDFAFINYTNHEAALRCVEAVNREKENDGSTKVMASLAKPVPNGKQRKQNSDPVGKQISKEKPKASKTTIRLHEPRKKGKPTKMDHGVSKIDGSSSITDELLQILRQQASSKSITSGPSIGTTISEHHFLVSGSKRPASLVGYDPLYSEPRGLPRACTESYYPISGPSTLSHGVGVASFPYHRQQGPGYAPESIHGRENYLGHLQTREQAPYNGNNDTYRRY